MGEHKSAMSEPSGGHESRDKTGSRADVERDNRARQARELGERQPPARSEQMIARGEQTPREHREQMIDKTLENSFPASDPPAWTSGVAPPVRPAHSRDPHTPHTPRDARGSHGVREAAHGVREITTGETAQERHARPSPRPALQRTPRNADRVSPGTAFWDKNAGERDMAAVSPSRDDASTDMIGRRDAPEGPHESFPGEPRNPEHREHVGATGDDALSLHRWSRDALYEQARGLRIKGRSRMTKAQLIEAVRAAQQSQSK